MGSCSTQGAPPRAPPPPAPPPLRPACSVSCSKDPLPSYTSALDGSKEVRQCAGASGALRSCPTRGGAAPPHPRRRAQVPTPRAVSTTATFALSPVDASTYEYTLTITGVTAMTMAHIHNAGPTANGGIVVGLVPVGVKATTPLPMLTPTQTGDFVFTGTVTTSDFVGALAGKAFSDFIALADANSLCEWLRCARPPRRACAQPSQHALASLSPAPPPPADVNIHTSAFPGGALRGQVDTVPCPPPPPSPAPPPPSPNPSPPPPPKPLVSAL